MPRSSRGTTVRGTHTMVPARVVTCRGTCTSTWSTPSALRVVGGSWPPATSSCPDSLATELGVGRSVIREALRVLESLGLVAATRRVGTRVLPSSGWNVYDPRVIAWRLAGSGEGAQLRSLTELRLAVEPLAAELAAQNASAEVGGELLETAARMRTLGRQGDLEGFLELDMAFHALVLKASGNEMFTHLDGAVAEVLRGRTNLGLMPSHPHEQALQLARRCGRRHPRRAARGGARRRWRASCAAPTTRWRGSGAEASEQRDLGRALGEAGHPGRPRGTPRPRALRRRRPSAPT